MLMPEDDDKSEQQQSPPPEEQTEIILPETDWQLALGNEKNAPENKEDD
jgi:hypothetical protein